MSQDDVTLTTTTESGIIEGQIIIRATEVNQLLDASMKHVEERLFSSSGLNDSLLSFLEDANSEVLSQIRNKSITTILKRLNSESEVLGVYFRDESVKEDTDYTLTAQVLINPITNVVIRDKYKILFTDKELKSIPTLADFRDSLLRDQIGFNKVTLSTDFDGLIFRTQVERLYAEGWVRVGETILTVNDEFLEKPWGNTFLSELNLLGIGSWLYVFTTGRGVTRDPVLAGGTIRFKVVEALQAEAFNRENAMQKMIEQFGSEEKFLTASEEQWKLNNYENVGALSINKLEEMLLEDNHFDLPYRFVCKEVEQQLTAILPDNYPFDYELFEEQYVSSLIDQSTRKAKMDLLYSALIKQTNPNGYSTNKSDPSLKVNLINNVLTPRLEWENLNEYSSSSKIRENSN